MNARSDGLASENQLTDAFVAFISAANRLEHSHWQLHDEVAQLRKQLEERNRALASSVAENERTRLVLRQILDALPCGVLVVDSGSHEIGLMNPETKRLLTIAANPPGWPDLPSCIRQSVESAGEESDEQEFRLGEGAGARWLTIRYGAIPQTPTDATNAGRRVILILRDVTAHKTAEQQRESSRNMVALAEMATVLAHEIRNPLASLELLSGLLASDRGLSNESQQYVQHLQAGMRSLAATVNNVLRLHSPGLPHLVPTKLGPALKSAVDFIRPLALQSAVMLTLEEALAETEIMADTSGLQQVMLNLACNALRHTPAGGEITILGMAEKGMAIVEVTDTGSGISRDKLAHIFEAGFSTTRQSAGLGLTVCQRIMEQHQGTISVSSVPGEGTRFRLEFPII